MLVAFYGIATNAAITMPAGIDRAGGESMSSGKLKMTSAVADQLLTSAGSSGARQARPRRRRATSVT